MLFIAFITEADVVPQALQVYDADPIEELRARFEVLLRHVLTPRQINMTRLMIEEADTLPTIAKAFYERVMKRGHRHIATTLGRLASEQPDLNLQATEELAAIVTGAIFGELHIRALLGENSALEDNQIKQRIDATLALIFARRRPS